MKNSNYNTQQHFESLVDLERKREIPIVNVRAAVRQSLAGEFHALDSDGVLDILLEWFSGIRGKIVTGVAVASALALAMVVYTQIGEVVDSVSTQENDQLSAFIDDGDWSSLL